MFKIIIMRTFISLLKKLRKYFLGTRSSHWEVSAAVRDVWLQIWQWEFKKDRLKTITQAVSEHMRFSAERARFSAEQAHVNFL